MKDQLTAIYSSHLTIVNRKTTTNYARKKGPYYSTIINLSHSPRYTLSTEGKMAEPAYVEGHYKSDPMVQIRKTRAETEILNAFYGMCRSTPTQDSDSFIVPAKTTFRETDRGDIFGDSKNHFLFEPSDAHGEHKHSMSDCWLPSSSSTKNSKETIKQQAPIAVIKEQVISAMSRKFKTHVTPSDLDICIKSLVDGQYLDIGTLEFFENKTYFIGFRGVAC